MGVSGFWERGIRNAVSPSDLADVRVPIPAGLDLTPNRQTLHDMSIVTEGNLEQ